MQDTNIYVFLTPIALFFVLLEVGACIIYRRDYLSFPEAIANFGTALGNQTVNGAALLWWHIINWSGILEAKPWLWASENLRVSATAVALVVMNSLFEPSAALFGLLAVSAYSILWTNLYFRPSSPRLVPA